MRWKRNTIAYFFLMIFYLVICTTLSAGCSVEDLGLLPANSLNEEEDVHNEPELKLSEAELFLEMKARQDKNQLSDSDIRKAIFHAVDREKIINELFGKYGKVSNSLFSASSTYWNQSWSIYDYDLEKAKQYLSHAGYGTDNPLYLTISAVDNSGSKQIIEEIIKEDLEKIGINLWIFNEPPKELYQDKIPNGDYELGLWSMFFSDSGDLASSFSSDKIPPMETEENNNCENFYWYNSIEVDDLLKQIENRTDPDFIREKVIEIQDILARDAVILPLYSRLFVLAYNNSLSQADLEILGEEPFLNIDNWKLPDDLEVPEGEKARIALGYKSDHIDIFNGFKKYFINDLLFRGLWKSKPDGSYEPDLLESFSKSEDEEYSEIPGLSLHVKLKDGIFWQDDTPITSYDIKYTLEYFKDFMDENEYFSRLDRDYNKIDEIRVVDEKNFIILFNEEMKNWQKLFDQVYKDGSFDIYGPDSLSYNNIISSGPYHIVEYDENGMVIFDINENFYGKIPEIGRLAIHFDPDINNLISMLKEDEIDALCIPADTELMTELEKDKDIQLLIKPGNLLEHLALSLKPSE